MYADSAADFTLALTLTVLFGLLTFLAWRSRGTGALLKGVGVTMLPLALWLSHILSLVSAIVDDIGNWASGLVFSPRVWVGLIVVAVAIVIFSSGTALGRRGAPVKPAKGVKSVTGTPRKGRSGDPEMDEIEALLRKRGIS